MRVRVVVRRRRRGYRTRQRVSFRFDVRLFATVTACTQQGNESQFQIMYMRYHFILIYHFENLLYVL